MKRIWLVVLMAFSPMAAWAQQADEAPDCASVATCVAILRDVAIAPPPKPGEYRSRGIDAKPIAKAVERLPSFGDAGVAALVGLLKHPNTQVRERGGFALMSFANIDKRHAPALIAAHRNGVGWLPTAIAKTGTDEALRFLWADFLNDPDHGSNSQTFFALPRFGDRVLRLLELELVRCRTSSDARLCSGVNQLLGQFKPYPAFAFPLIEAIARSPDASDDVRDEATQVLIRRQQPYGLTVLTRSLEQMLADLGPARAGALSVETPGPSGLPIDWDLEFLIGDIAEYGEKAVATGPLLTQLLSRRDAPDARAEAALAIGLIGYREGAPELLEQATAFDHDWKLAYNVTESLGRLRFEGARATLEHLRDTHWNFAVRNNATRALNMLDGGAFERPGVAGDVVEPDDVAIGAAWLAYRYQGDRDAAIPSCTTGSAQSYGQFFVEPLAWPDQAASAKGAVGLDVFMPPVFDSYPDWLPGFESDGALMFSVRNGNGLLVGTDAGEFGGSVSHVRRGQRREVLIADNALAAFVVGRKVMIATGLSHMISSHGELWIVDMASGEAVVEHRVRLPFEPTGFAMAYPETLIVQTGQGDVGVRADGTVVDVRDIAACGAAQAG